jgi:hypothetical protein
LESELVETQRAFGFLFICVSLAVGSAAIISEVAKVSGAPVYFHAIIWILSFAVVFGAAIPKFRKIAPAIRGRMKASTKWSLGSKALNALCWAGPFLAIAAFPSLYQYLILAGIGLGNLSTFFLVKKYSGNDNREQLIVGSVSLASLPLALSIDITIFSTNQDIAIMISRMLIALSYAAGGGYALTIGKLINQSS